MSITYIKNIIAANQPRVHESAAFALLEDSYQNSVAIQSSRIHPQGLHSLSDLQPAVMLMPMKRLHHNVSEKPPQEQRGALQPEEPKPLSRVQGNQIELRENWQVVV